VDATAAPPASTPTSSLAPGAANPWTVSVAVTNTGAVAGSKVVMGFVSVPGAGGDAPRRTLVGMEKVHLLPGQSTTVRFSSDSGAGLGYCAFCLVAQDGKTRDVLPGAYRFVVGDGGVGAPLYSAGVTATGAAVSLPL
jgi:beta-glucosidase